MQPPQLQPILQTLNPTLTNRIHTSRILVIGSGGIGCELLKNLSLSGFRHIEVIDLDTIDISNLNRQFLFRKHHVGLPKCKVACDAASKMSPCGKEAKFIPHFKKVQDFDIHFFKTFDVVLNALDNVEARRYVNRVCLAAGVTLVEAGSTGYLGQVTVIDKKAGVECYECQTKPTQKVYPICTIRSTPSQPVHCIVWAKELYKLLFGKAEESMLYEDPQADEPSSYMDIVMAKPDLKEGMTLEEKTQILEKYTFEVLEALFVTEIRKQITMQRYETASKSPVPFDHKFIREGISTPPPSPKQTTILTPLQSISLFHQTIVNIYLHSQSFPPEFDKDDSLSLTFITSTSNLRQHIFSITPLQSLYTAKGIAGNIIPAIATTNAIIAGLQVLQLYHILSTQIQQCKYIYCLREPTRKGNILQPTTLSEPNPNCFVCRNAKLELTLNVQNWTLRELIDKIFKRHLGFMEPTVFLGEDVIIYEEGEDADVASFETNLSKTLTDLPRGGVKHGSLMRIEDFIQDLEVDCSICHKEDMCDEEDGGEERFEVHGETPEVRKEEVIEKAEEKEGEDDDEVVVEEEDAVEVITKPEGWVEKKRKRLSEEGEEIRKKKKVEKKAETVVIDDLE